MRKSKVGEQIKDSKDVKASQTSLARPTSSAPHPEHGDTGNVDWLPPKTLLKPPGQLELSEKELDEEFTRILNANNPHAPQNIARYNNKERTYKTSKDIEHIVVHFDFEGHLLYKGVEESAAKSAEGAKSDDQNSQGEGATTSVGTTTETEPPVTEEKAQASKQQPRNQFNYSDRATQTFNNPLRTRSTNTEPPPHKTFSAAVNQWSIFDAYTEDALAKEKAAKDKTKSGATNAKGHREDEKRVALQTENHNEDVYHGPDLKRALSIIERMVNQNTYDEISQDFKYWEDAADEFREGKEGSLLPLWQFAYEREKKKHVTALCWNPQCSDLFAVGYGSYDFSKQGPGLICCFSLKNPSYPEFIFSTESGVMCLHFNPTKANLIAVGLYDGSTLVYDLHSKNNEPLFKSKVGKHTDPVWQVNWQPDDLDGNPNFFSVSSDGRVTQWTLLKNELVHTDVIKLHPVENSGENASSKSEDQKSLTTLSGTCFDFNKGSDTVFVVGTEEGKIFKCSKAYNSQYLLTFDGHFMGTYGLAYNKYYTNAFLSASGDWTAKLWVHDSPQPVMVFDLNSPVNEVAWAPFSSTVFAAVTAEGKVFIYDLEVNKYDPICEQQIVRKARLTHISFNPFEPILIVGDDKGTIVSLKLSPNLRKVGRGNQKTTPEEQKERLERIILLSTGKNIDAMR